MTEGHLFVNSLSVIIIRVIYWIMFKIYIVFTYNVKIHSNPTANQMWLLNVRIHLVMSLIPLPDLLNSFVWCCKNRPKWFTSGNWIRPRLSNWWSHTRISKTAQKSIKTFLRRIRVREWRKSINLNMNHIKFIVFKKIEKKGNNLLSELVYDKDLK